MVHPTIYVYGLFFKKIFHAQVIYKRSVSEGTERQACPMRVSVQFAQSVVSHALVVSLVTFLFALC